MTLFYLIRHGTNDYLPGRLAGRSPGVSLNVEGNAQAAKLAECLKSREIHKIFSSPLERARETAEPFAKAKHLPIEVTPEVLEIDFGDWTGRQIDELNQVQQWNLFNSFRAGTKIPNGELMVEAQFRMVRFVERCKKEFAEQTIAIFSHGDPIKLTLAHYLGIPIDLFTRIEISPASFSILGVDDYSARVFTINSISHLE
ncbi:MAG: histidine phosphatase family protein [Verrucomicrobiales bacterium]